MNSRKISVLGAVVLLTASVILILNATSIEGEITLPDIDRQVSVAQFDTLEWPRPRFTERQEERHRLVETGIKQQGIQDSSTLEAMRHVPRHLFVPEPYRQYAYQNRPLPIGFDQTISQPYIVAYMTSLLELSVGEKVLEIGTGSGYQAAVLSEITPHVYTIEIVEELATRTSKLFEKLGYETIKTKIGDGFYGWEKYAPYDAVIVTAAPEEIPQPLVDQLKSGGVIVIPVGSRSEGQYVLKVTKDEDGEIYREKKIPVRFVPFTGDAQQESYEDSQ